MNTILLVDDEPLVARLHARAVRTAGFEPIIAEDGETALAHIAQTQPLLIVTDMNMPGMSGFELAVMARSGGYDRPIILLSGDDHVRLLTEGLRAGVDDFIVKGMPFATLSALLTAWGHGPFKRLPAHIRTAALGYFDMAWPLGPPIAQLRADLPVLEARASTTLKDLLMHAPDGFGDQHANRVRLLGVASGILTTLTRSDPLARLRLPGLLLRLLALHPPTQALLADFEALQDDATFQHAHECLRLV
jgi:CheY-like chemotaxis protein